MPEFKQVTPIGDPKSLWYLIGVDEGGRVWHGQPSLSGTKWTVKWTVMEQRD